MQTYINAIDELDALSDDAFLLRMMMADSFEIKYDSEGRISIPDNLISFAEISNIAVFMGIGRSFLIWSATEYQKQYIIKRYIEGKIINGKREGIWLTYSEKGNLLFKTFYENGSHNGIWETYHENGNIKLIKGMQKNIKMKFNSTKYN